MEGTKDTKGMFGIKGIKWYRVSIEMIYSKNQDYKVFKPCKVVFLNHIPFISFIPPLYVRVSPSKNFMIFHDFCYNSDCFLSILSESGGKIKMDGIKGIIGIKGMFGIKGIKNKEFNKINWLITSFHSYNRITRFTEDKPNLLKPQNILSKPTVSPNKHDLTYGTW